MQNKKMSMTGEPNKVLVEMDTQDAENFILFMQYKAQIDALIVAGVFNIKFGKAILNFSDGILQNIMTEMIVFKRTNKS